MPAITENSLSSISLYCRCPNRPVDEMRAAIIHIAAGIAVLVLAWMRHAIRRRRGVPIAHVDNPAIVNWIGHAAHILHYGFIFIMPITGLVAWFGGVELSTELHELGRLILIPVIGLPVLGAFAEHFVFHNDSLRRMLTLDRAHWSLHGDFSVRRRHSGLRIMLSQTKTVCRRSKPSAYPHSAIRRCPPR